ncbi:MAG: response regulator transcription factor, partial [Lysobacteraceae bacterium]
MSRPPATSQDRGRKRPVRNMAGKGMDDGQGTMAWKRVSRSVKQAQPNLRRALTPHPRAWQAMHEVPMSTVHPTPLGRRVLVIEDQHDIAANIWDFLERRGYEVDHCADGVAGLAQALKGSFDVIVLDLGLPRLDGLDLCRQMRESGHGVPILMLTARDTLDDKLRGFAEGADDYLVKPFELRELEARIRAVQRRTRHGGGALSYAGLSYDAATMSATRAGMAIPLPRLQGDILAVLLREAPKVVPHAALLAEAWAEGRGDVA